MPASEGSDVALQLLWEEPGSDFREQWDASFGLVKCGLPGPISNVKYFGSISYLETNMQTSHCSISILHRIFLNHQHICNCGTQAPSEYCARDRPALHVLKQVCDAAYGDKTLLHE